MSARTYKKWEDRCAELATWVRDNNGQPPSALSGNADERSLYVWLSEARRRAASGAQTPERTTMFEAATSGLRSATRTRVRIEQLAAFQARTGRLPKSTAPLGSEERDLATALIQGIRPRLRKGLLKPEHVEALGRIPGAAEIRLVPDQDDTMEELAEYAENHGHMPPLGGRGTATENRLADWWRNNTRGDAAAKTPRLRDRHLALLALEDTYPTKSAAKGARAPRGLAA